MFNVQGFPMRNAGANAHARSTPWDSDSDCLTSKVSLCEMQGQMHMPDPLHGVLDASHTAP